MTILKVRARRNEGFWRAKRFWPREWTVARDLTDEQALSVLSEPHLEVEELKPTDRVELPDVSAVQPGPPAIVEPEVFKDPVLREKQVQRLEEDKAKGILNQRAAAQRADLNDEQAQREPIEKKPKK